MAFNRMRRRPLEHGFFPQVVDTDFGWIAQGSLAQTQYQPVINGPLVTMVASGGPYGNTPIASIQRIASGNFTVFIDPTLAVGEKLIDASVDVMCSTTGFIASYDAYIGSYRPPTVASGAYNGTNAGFGQLTVYTQPRATASLGTLNDVSSLAIASIRVWMRWGDGDY